MKGNKITAMSRSRYGGIVPSFGSSRYPGQRLIERRRSSNTNLRATRTELLLGRINDLPENYSPRTVTFAMSRRRFSTESRESIIRANERRGDYGCRVRVF